MKKSSLFIMSIIIVAVTVIAFAFTQNIASAPTTTIQNIHVSGCPNNDCSQLSYCLDGGPSIPVGSCDFTIKCSEGQHFICIKCSSASDVGGGMSFKCGASNILNINIPDLKNCDCSSKK